MWVHGSDSARAPVPVLLNRWARVLLAEFGIEKTVSVEGLSADKFGGELQSLMKGS